MKIREFILTMGGLGHIPKAPGTWGSLGTLIIALVIVHFYEPVQAHQIFIMLTVIVSGLCMGLSEDCEAIFGEKDPPQVVLDEAAGLFLAIAIAQPSAELALPILIGCFVFFRLFDIWKPWPIKEIQDLPGGLWTDDLLAGALAGLIFQIQGVQEFLAKLI